ncbi:Heterodisulfide reductase subunit A-like protein [uncultured archaeon]|nr:Heterodisulfide reductase subunit A-like protein [uncultured archaeon]
MTKRKIIKISEEKCNGCGVCIPNCPEGAIQVIDGKARLISDIFCDGLGACIGHCPQDAISTEEREAESYNEKKAMDNIIKAGNKIILAHLNHLKDHGEHHYLKQALEVLKEKNIIVPFKEEKIAPPQICGCPGVKTIDFSKEKKGKKTEQEVRISHLGQWPVQLHLVSPNASYFQKNNVLLVEDCVAYALGDFHKDYLQGKSLAIACPKLDTDQESYLQKLIALINDAHITSLTVMTMEVPCCRGLLALAQQAVSQAKVKIPMKSIVVGIKGTIIKEEIIP